MSVPIKGETPRNFIIPPSSTMGFCVALIRIFLGIKLFVMGLTKWSWIFGRNKGSFAVFVNDLLHNGIPLVWYAPFLRNTVLNHLNIFTWLVVIGELVLGLMLMFGFCTRLASFLAIIMLFHYLCASWGLGIGFQGLNQALILMAFICMITGAGRVLGIDFDNANKNNRSILW